MRTKRWSVVVPSAIAFLIILLLSINTGSARADEVKSGGEGGVNAPTPFPTAVGGEQLELQITNTYIDQDYTPKFHIVGTITNHGNTVVGGVKVIVQVTDSSGKSVVTDYGDAIIEYDEMYLTYSTIQAGETAPFDLEIYYSGTPANFSAVISDFNQYSTNYAQANVQVRNIMIQDTDNVYDAYVYLTGELVNQENSWVEVGTLMGTLFDDQGTLIAAGSMYAYRSALAPAGDERGRDVTPFMLMVLDPGTPIASADVHFYPHTEDAPSVWLDAEATNTYYDSLGYYHVVGWLSNNGAEPWISDSIVSGFYDQAGNVVNVGWDFEFNYYLEPGSRVPFDAYVLHQDIGVNLESSSISRMTVETDGYRSGYLDALVYVPLTTANESLSKDGSRWTVTGTVTNDSGLNLRTGTVTTMVLDAQGNLVATDWDGINNEGDRFYPNDTVAFEVNIDLDPIANTSGYTTQTMVQAWYGVNDEQGNAGYRPPGPLTPEITTYIPRPTDISTEPKVLGGNIILAALIMLPFAVAAELFTRTLGKKERLLQDKFKPIAWINRFTAWLEKKTSTTLHHPKLMDVLKLLGVLFFYGLTFSLLEPGWKPFTSAGLSLFAYMTIAYGVVGLADDFVQWRTLRKWGERADLAVRPTNLLIAIFSVAVSRIFHLLPGLLFGTPEALDTNDEALDAEKRSRLIKKSALTAGVLILAFWLPTLGTGLLLKSSLSSGLFDVISGFEAFLLVIFAVALENSFVKMLGFSEGYGHALRKKNRWIWILVLIGITFLFLHTLLNPRGGLSDAMQEGRVLVFLIASCSFMVLAFILWLIYGRERKAAVVQPMVMPPIPPVKPVIPQAPAAPPRIPTQEVKAPPLPKAETAPVKLPPLPKREEPPAPAVKTAVMPPFPVAPEQPKPVKKVVSIPPLPPSEEKKQSASMPPLPAAVKTCIVCGNSNPMDAKFCANCGSKLG